MGEAESAVPMGAETTDRQTYLSKTGIRADRRLNQTIARAAIAAAVTTGAGVIMSPCRNRAKWSRVTPVKPENAAIPSPSVDTNPKCRLPTWLSPAIESAARKVEIEGFKIHHFLDARRAVSSCQRAVGMAHVQRPESESPRSDPQFT